MIVFGTDCNFFTVLPIQLKTCRFNVFFFFMFQNVRARKIGRVSEVLRVRASPIGIGRAICPGLLVQELIKREKRENVVQYEVHLTGKNFTKSCV